MPLTTVSRTQNVTQAESSSVTHHTHWDHYLQRFRRQEHLQKKYPVKNSVWPSFIIRMLQSSLSQQICDTHKNKCTWKWVLWRDYPSTFKKYTPCSVWDLGLKWRGGKQLRFFHVLSNVSDRLWSRKGINIFGRKKWSLWILRIGILNFFLFV